MSTVTFNPGRSLTDDLVEATINNNLTEIDRITNYINSKKFETYLEFSTELKNLVDELDPFDQRGTIELIFRNVSSEHKKLFDPVNVILKVPQKQQQRKRRLTCFN